MGEKKRRKSAAAKLGKKGGDARAEALGPNKRKQIADEAAGTRWGKDGMVAIYHRVFEREDHDASCHILWNLVRDAATRWPEKQRVLYLDIDGHRNTAGGFDADMFDLQTQFVIGHLMTFLTAAHIPLHQTARLTNERGQSNDMPELLKIGDGRTMLVKAVGSYDRALLDRAYARVTGKQIGGDTLDAFAEEMVGSIVFGADRKQAEAMVKAIGELREAV